MIREYGWLALGIGCWSIALLLAYRMGVRYGRRTLPKMPRRGIYDWLNLKPEWRDWIPIWGYRRLRRRASSAMNRWRGRN